MSDDKQYPVPKSKYSDLLIWQYKKTKAIATTNAVMSECDIAFANCIDLAKQLDINTAEHYSLDLVGKHVGASRLARQYIPKPFFGWSEDDTSLGFDIGEWYMLGDQLRYDSLLNDEDYRFLIRAKVLKNYQTAEIGNIVDSVQFLFGKVANIVDNYDMTMNAIIPFGVMNDFRVFAVKNLDILVRPIGVKLRFFEVANHPFGWYEDDTAFGFDDGVWSDFV